MIGDKIIITSAHRKKAKVMFTTFLKKYKQGAKYVFCIGGEAGTGKTEIAMVLRTMFYEHNYKIRGELVHTDDYYRTKWSERNQIRKRTGLIGKKELDWDKLNGIINTYKTDFYNTLIIQRINKFTDSIEKAILNHDKIDVLIVEGLYALYIKKPDFSVFLEGTYKETKSFRQLRNKEPQNAFRQKVLAKEHKDVIKSKRYADIIL